MPRWSMVLALALVLSGCVAHSGGYYPVSSYSGGYGHGYGHGHNREPEIHIIGATYSAGGHRQCDASRWVRIPCDGSRSCSVKASNHLCGDPAKGVAKQLTVSYSCGHGRREVRLSELRIEARDLESKAGCTLRERTGCVAPVGGVGPVKYPFRVRLERAAWHGRRMVSCHKLIIMSLRLSSLRLLRRASGIGAARSLMDR